jgi:DNA polymerase-3 subunit alpha
MDNSLEILDKAKDFKFTKQLVMPPVEISPIYLQDSDPYRSEAIAKMKKVGRINEDPAYIGRLEYELRVISKNGVVDFLPYFLFLAQVCETAREKGIAMGPCRGSAGGSLVSYWLGITHLDPIKLNLPFERFLSFDRIKRQKFPDIDLDFDAVRRPELVEYLQTKYGTKCAQIGTHSTLGLKQALQDSSRAVYGEVLPEIYAMNRDLKSAPQGVNIHDYLYGYTDEDGNVVQGYIEQNPRLNQFLTAQPKIKNLLERMCGITRQFGRHAGGFCLADRDIFEYIPTAKIGKEAHYITQYSKDWVEKAGLIKMDLLGVNTLADIGSCLKLIKNRYNKDIDIYNLPEDPEVFEQYHRGDTITVFQMEPGTTCHYDARAKRSWLRDMKPNSIADLAVVTALVRPGALDAIIEDGKTTAAAAYVDRKNGAKFEYLHPDLANIVGDTYGIFTYQEQVMQLFIELAGYSMEKADVVREGIGKKKQDVIDAAKKDLEKALLGREGWTQEKINILTQQVQAFAKYAFNKSHAAGYGMLSYISAFLKKKYPLEWWTSVLSNSDKEEIKDKYWSSVKEFVLLPSVNNKNTNFEIFDNKIKSPLSLIHGIGPSAYQELVAKAPYVSLLDLFTRTNGRVVKVDTIAALAYAGAFSELTTKNPADIMQEYFIYKKAKDPKYKQTKDFSKFSKIDTLLKIKKHLPMLRIDYSDYYAEDFKVNGYSVAIEQHRASGVEFYKQSAHGNELVMSSAETALKYKDKHPLKQGVSISLLGLVSEIKTFEYTKKSTGERKSAVKVKLITRDQPFSIIYWGQSICPIEVNSLVMVSVPYEDIIYNDRDYLSFGKFKATVIDRKNIVEEGDE